VSLRVVLGLALSGSVFALTGVRACVHPEQWPGPKEPMPSTPLAVSAPSGVVQPERPRGPHPRILLTPDRLASLRGLRDADAPSWQKLVARCDEDVREPIRSGYEAWDWSNATLDLALCSAVSRRPEYGSAAIKYFHALLDDRYNVGDGAGGDLVVRHDDGYSIRTRGCFGAIAYDWLHDAPGMTPELRRHARDRFAAWNQWFAQSGYSRDQPIANYYMGWFGAVAFAGLAAEGDEDPRMRELSQAAAHMYRSDIIPVYSRKLAGGDFPEGWQYGDMVGAILAIFADAEAGASRTPLDELPWLTEMVTFRGHALWPDGRHMLDTGDWSNKPAVAPAHAMLALAAVLPPAGEAARRARVLARLASDPADEWAWLVALADDPSRPGDDVRAAKDPLSYVASGTATLTARSDWSKSGVWFALTSAPSLSDHQHLDAGHFEIVRGSDPLLTDGGGYGSYSSLSHNVIVVDDHKENDTYAPNQGTWSDDATISRHQDSGRFVYALADYASAYNPVGYPVNHPGRSVARAERAVVFSRSPVPGLGAESARVVVYDRVTLTRPAYRVTFLLHGQAPELHGKLEGAGGIRFGAGESAAFVTTIIPAGVAPALVHEPTPLGEGPYYANDPPEGTKSARIEVRAPQSGVERRFLHTIVVTGSEVRSLPSVRIEGDAVDGVAIADEAYVFSRAGEQLRPAPLSYSAPPTATRHIVASLTPHATYAVAASREGESCRVALTPGPGTAASDAGVVEVGLTKDCVTR
jgi:hypothetical protein